MSETEAQRKQRRRIERWRRLADEQQRIAMKAMNKRDEYHRKIEQAQADPT